MIYLDNAATTQLCPAAKKIIMDNLDNYYNTASVYQPARELNLAVEQAREKIAELIGARLADEIYFTSGGCEANSWALNEQRVAASCMEHSSIRPFRAFDVDDNGMIDLENFKIKLGEAKYRWPEITNIVSYQMVNNEIGIINPIKELAQIVHNNHMTFHTDAVQAIPHMRINVSDLNVDMLSASSHKFNGPKGVGFLYIKNGVYINPMIRGGSQEKSFRGGTTNAIGVLAMAAALENTVNNLDEINSKIAYLTTKLRDNLLSIKRVELNVDPSNTPCVNGILNLRIDGTHGADVVAMADRFGIYISSGSACHEGDSKPSHVLTAIGLTEQEALSSIRVSIGRYNTEEEIDKVSELFPKIIQRLRAVRKI